MNWWRRIANAVNRRARTLRLYVAAVPLSRLGNADGVATLLPEILKHAPHQRTTVVEHWCRHIRDVLVFPVQPSRAIKVAFAHPSPELTGFAVNRAPDSIRDVLLLNWWEDASIAYELLVAHVCDGAAILRDNAWRTVFPNWVSYDAFIEGFYDSPGAVARWGRIVKATLDAAVDGRSAVSAANLLRLAYVKEMVDMDKLGTAADGDPLNLIYFQGALNALTTSEDHT